MYSCWSYPLKRLLILKCWVWSDSSLKVVQGQKLPYTASDWMLLLNSQRAQDHLCNLMLMDIGCKLKSFPMIWFNDWNIVQMMRGQDIYLISACTLPRHSLLKHCRCVGVLFFSWHIETWKHKNTVPGSSFELKLAPTICSAKDYCISKFNYSLHCGPYYTHSWDGSCAFDWYDWLLCCNNS